MEKENIKNWFKNKNNLYLFLIIAFAIIIRLYYFSITKDQALWWDEADYMAYAKTIAGLPSSWQITTHHLSFFPYIAALFFKLGFSEVIIKAILELLPSIFLVFLTYSILSLMYKDKRIALISTLLMATFWVVLFNSFRFHVDIPGLFLAFLAIHIFWQGYEKKQRIFGKINPNFAIPITVILTILAYSIRRAYFIFGAFFLVYMLATKPIKHLLKDKYNWIALAIAIALLFVFESFVFTSSLGDTASAFYVAEHPITMAPFRIFSTYFNSGSEILSVLKYLLLIGFVIITLRIFFSFEYLRKKEYSESKADLFNFLAIFLTMFFFLFISRSATYDPRWYLPLILGCFVCISKSTLTISRYIKKYNKYLAILVILLLIGYGSYYQYGAAEMAIKTKTDSFEGIKDASLQIKQISQPTDIIISASMPQPAYYAERETLSPARLTGIDDGYETNKDIFLQKIRENSNIKYLIITFSEQGYPTWLAYPTFAGNQYASWEIPFMDSRVDFATGEQNIQQSKTYGPLEFRLLSVTGDAFVYEILR